MFVATFVICVHLTYEIRFICKFNSYKLIGVYNAQLKHTFVIFSVLLCFTMQAQDLVMDSALVLGQRYHILASSFGIKYLLVDAFFFLIG